MISSINLRQLDLLDTASLRQLNISTDFTNASPLLFRNVPKEAIRFSFCIDSQVRALTQPLFIQFSSIRNSRSGRSLSLEHEKPHNSPHTYKKVMEHLLGQNVSLTNIFKINCRHGFISLNTNLPRMIHVTCIECYPTVFPVSLNASTPSETGINLTQIKAALIAFTVSSIIFGITCSDTKLCDKAKYPEYFILYPALCSLATFVAYSAIRGR